MYSRLIYQINIQVYNLYPTHKNATTSSDSKHFSLKIRIRAFVCVRFVVVGVVSPFFFSLLHSNFNTFDTYNTHFDESIPIVECQL